jgi:hypothetical protein
MASMLRTLFLAISLLSAFVTQPLLAAEPSCFPPVEISRAKIVRVERNGVLVLADGRAAKLEGILLPAGAGDHAPAFFAEQSIAKLGELATAQVMSLAADAPKEDRYGRLRAQAFLASGSGERWLQRALLEQGLARVSIAPDRDECAAELYAAESRARERKLGVWSLDAYRVRSPGQFSNEGGTFQIVEGVVQDVSSNGGRIFLEFGHDRRNDFAVLITADDMRIFRSIGVDPFSYRNQTVRVRGWIDQSRHPQMEIATPSDVEVIASPTLRGPISAPD